MTLAAALKPATDCDLGQIGKIGGIIRFLAAKVIVDH